MADAWHYFGNDLQVGPTGDLLTSDSSEEGRQRVLRRVLTLLEDYIWDLVYGAGLPSYIGKPINQAQLQGAVQSQMFKEAVVMKVPPPTISVTPGPSNGFFVNILYVDADTGSAVPLAFNVTP